MNLNDQRRNDLGKTDSRNSLKDVFKNLDRKVKPTITVVNTKDSAFKTSAGTCHCSA